VPGARRHLAPAIAPLWHYGAQILSGHTESKPIDHMEWSMLKVLIGLVLPFVGVVGMLPWVASNDIYVLGIPFIYAWIFGWFVLTSVCLQLCWVLFDKPATRRETRSA
jgi:hypothetical protein